MTREQLLEKSLGDLREIAKLQGAKSLTKYRKGELVDIIMNGGVVPDGFSSEEATDRRSARQRPKRSVASGEAPDENVPRAPDAQEPREPLPRDDALEQRPRYQLGLPRAPATAATAGLSKRIHTPLQQSKL